MINPGRNIFINGADAHARIGNAYVWHPGSAEPADIEVLNEQRHACLA